MYTADTLSHAHIQCTEPCNLQEEADLLMEISVENLPVSSQRTDKLTRAQATDSICSTLIFDCENDWPDKHLIRTELKPYWKCTGQLTTHSNLLLYGTRIVIPLSMQQEILQKLHEGHQGIQRCHLRAKISVWWPGISKQINDLIERCSVCVRESSPRIEPLIPSKFPDYLRQKDLNRFILHEELQLHTDY